MCFTYTWYLKNILGNFFFLSFNFKPWLKYNLYFTINCIGGVMVSVLASSAVIRGFEPRSGQTKAIELIFVASSLSTQY